MYKINSNNLQRKASKLPVFSGCTESHLLKEVHEKRDALTKNLRIYEQRIHEIRTALNVPAGYKFNKISPKAFSPSNKFWVEWQQIMPLRDEIIKQLSGLPKPTHREFNNYMLSYLESNYPEIHNLCKIGGKEILRREMEK